MNDIGFIHINLESNMIHLKTKPGIEPQRFAVLHKPKITPGTVDSDEALYALVQSYGLASVQEFKADNPLELEDCAVRLTPNAFQSVWMGD